MKINEGYARPNLDMNLDSKTFKSFYYLKEELVSFCKRNGLPASGGKIEITSRIAYYLDTVKLLPVNSQAKSKTDTSPIFRDTLIEANIVCSEKHRAFFKKEIGKSFSFNVAFQKWLKNNTGKTYEQAIDAYHKIIEDKKHSKTTIDKQFEYNTYIRDFFEDNHEYSLNDAIKCWKYKKGISGHNCYEKADLIALG